MQTLQHELAPGHEVHTTADHPVLRRLDADQAVAYVEEVRLLRERVATLETALEAAKANARTHAPTSEFSEPLVPAVVCVQPPAVAAAPAPVSNPGFAQAWAHEDEASFEERVAEKAFFQATTIDEQSRSWLMKK